MTRKAIGRAALLVAAGFWIASGVPSRAAGSADDDVVAETGQSAGKPLSLSKPVAARKHTASRSRKSKLAMLKTRKVKVAARPIGAKTVSKNSEIPQNVANANAEMRAVDARGEAAVATAPAAPLEDAANQQLTELGRSLTETPASVMQAEPAAQDVSAQTSTAFAAAPAMAPEPPRPAPLARAAPSGEVSKDAWAQSSLIGKIFIAFGGMLTLASAARMLIA